MSEIKFACPHCHQHIACDDGYCGYQIRCPACQGGMIVPRRAAFGRAAATNLSLALPVGTPVPRAAAAAEFVRGRRLASERERGWAPGKSAEETPGEEGFFSFLRALVIGVLVVAGGAALLLAVFFAGCALMLRGID